MYHNALPQPNTAVNVPVRVSWNSVDAQIPNHDSACTRRVMIVDDEPHIVRALERLLRRENYELVTFTDPQKAAAYGKFHAVSVLITDQNMPAMDGLDLLQIIREHQPQCVSIMASGMNDSGTLLNAINSGGIFRFVCKPWVDNDLLHIIQQAIEYNEESRLTQQLADKARVANGTLSRHRAYLRELETKYPGLTKVERDENGAIVLPQ